MERLPGRCYQCSDRLYKDEDGVIHHELPLQFPHEPIPWQINPDNWR